jgi:hypothetical protein
MMHSHSYTYIQVWCIYEWLSVLHFKRTFIFPSVQFSEKFIELTLQSVSNVVDPSVFVFMEQVRLQCGSIMPLFVDYMSRVSYEGGIFSKELFVASLQVLIVFCNVSNNSPLYFYVVVFIYHLSLSYNLKAYKEEDKIYAHDNISKIYNPFDLLFLHLLGSKAFSLQSIGVQENVPVTSSGAGAGCV